MANHKKKKKVEVAKEKAVFLDLIYMTPSEVTVKEMADFLKESGEVMVDFWGERDWRKTYNIDTFSFLSYCTCKTSGFSFYEIYF